MRIPLVPIWAAVSDSTATGCQGRAWWRLSVREGAACALGAAGDLRSDAARPPEGIYTGPMEEGVRYFQARHGLDEDGVLGRGNRRAQCSASSSACAGCRISAPAR
ncbi:peptidoglycan-binding protein [Massilia sp. Mn16-1_5]|uniref:peptidoglycan-binding protein n=1 Tax=Massilia sp. Mn16-1_5 TaxID=2079199 RepID=UPI00109E4079|nr:hypothetical protein C2862_23280 [Massilia sp. Mn16-1_5]